MDASVFSHLENVIAPAVVRLTSGALLSHADRMAAEAAWFRSFVADEEGGWDAYLAAMRLPGTWGDDPEVQALCELYGRPAEIWAYDASLGARRMCWWRCPGGRITPR